MRQASLCLLPSVLGITTFIAELTAHKQQASKRAGRPVVTPPRRSQDNHQDMELEGTSRIALGPCEGEGCPGLQYRGSAAPQAA